MQPIFCGTETGTNYDPKAGPSDRWHAFTSRGAVLALGTDWPRAAPPDPFVNMQEAVTREIWRCEDTADLMNQPFDGAGQGGAHPTGKIYSPEERITVQQALDAYTHGSAYVGFMDDRVGTLERTRALMTLVGGKIVYDIRP